MLFQRCTVVVGGVVSLQWSYSKSICKRPTATGTTMTLRSEDPEAPRGDDQEDQRIPFDSAYGEALRSHIIDLEQQLADLKAIGDYFAPFFTHSLALLCVVNTEGVFKHLNPRWQDTLGYPLDAIRAMSLADLLHPDDLAPAMAGFQQLLEGELPQVQLVNRCRCANGSYKMLRWHASFDPAVQAIYANAEDITVQHLAEEATQRHASLLQLILDSMSDAAVVADDEGHILLINPAAAAMFGDQGGLFVARTSEDAGLLLPDGLTPCPPDAMPLARAIRGEPTDNVELILRNQLAPQGRWLAMSGRPLLEKGVPRGGVVLCRDVTQRKLAEDAAQIYEQTVSNMLVAMLVCQLDEPASPASLRLIAANAAARMYTGVDAPARLGERIADMFPALATPSLLATYADIAINGGMCDLGDVPYGASFFSLRVFALAGQRVCISFEDITERKYAEEALRQATVQEEIIRAQAAALAELSTPLIPLSEHVVVMPLIGTVDSKRAQQVMDTLLHGISETRARTAILDITGVSVVDTQVANVFISAAQAVKLLGAQVLLTGIRPEVAQTLIGLGVNLGGIVTHSSLQSGIAMALGRGGLR
ncbi:PAS domain-containing protein [Chloroflexia bacterium SDU3-3]|nr:PAS domain-containing protein [Chloroflexia bacterium SDU3-3]